MEPRVFCLSVVWNHRDRLGLLLRSLDEQTRRPDGIMVIDAASRDGTSTWVAQNHPYVSVLRLFQRHGLTHAWRQAVRFALQRVPSEARTHAWILVLAPETMLAQDAIEKLLDEARARPDAGAIGPVVLQAWKHEREDEVMHEVEPTQQVASLGLQLRRDFAWQYGHAGQGYTPSSLPETRAVLALPGLAAMYRADDLAELLDSDGLWTKSFEQTEPLFMDAALRLRDRGKVCYLSPSALAWRVDYRGSLVGREKWAMEARHERDRQRLVELGAHGVLWWKTLPWRFVRWCSRIWARIVTRPTESMTTEGDRGARRRWNSAGSLWPLLKSPSRSE